MVGRDILSHDDHEMSTVLMNISTDGGVMWCGVQDGSHVVYNNIGSCDLQHQGLYNVFINEWDHRKINAFL